MVLELAGNGVQAITNQPRVLAFAPCPEPPLAFRWTGRWWLFLLPASLLVLNGLTIYSVLATPSHLVLI